MADKNKYVELNEDNDFGFTFSNEDDIITSNVEIDIARPENRAISIIRTVCEVAQTIVSFHVAENCSSCYYNSSPHGLTYSEIRYWQCKTGNIVQFRDPDRTGHFPSYHTTDMRISRRIYRFY